MTDTQVPAGAAAPARYGSVNGAWPADLPTITDQEAVELVRRLYRKFMGRKLTRPIRIASGNRHTWVGNDGSFVVNPKPTRSGAKSGWHDIVHGLSHWVHRIKYPRHKPHDGRGTHAFIEREMIQHVVASGWLDGKLKRKPRAVKPPPPKEDVTAARLAALDVRIKRWGTKAKRAETALAKLTRERRRLERAAVRPGSPGPADARPANCIHLRTEAGFGPPLLPRAISPVVSEP